MTERFNALVARGVLDFEAWFSNQLHPERSWNIEEETWTFPHQYLRSIPFTKGRLKVPPYFFLRRPDLVVSLHSDPSFVFGWGLARLLRIPVAFRYLITFDAWVQRKPWREVLKRFMFRRVEATLSPGEQSAADARLYGVPASRALILPQAVNVRHFGAARELNESERRYRRDELGLKGVTFIYVGRLRWGKGLEYLIDAFARLQREIDIQMSLLFVGDGAEEEPLHDRGRALGIENCFFTGFVQRADLVNYYALADVFVFPTLGDPYGQVINEAMASGLPIVATRSTGDIEARVEDGVNGFIVAPADTQDLQVAMRTLAEGGDLRHRMGLVSAEKIEGQTPERWAETFEQHVQHILSMPRAKARIWSSQGRYDI